MKKGNTKTRCNYSKTFDLDYDEKKMELERIIKRTITDLSKAETDAIIANYLKKAI